MDRVKASQISADVLKALAKVEKKFGINFSQGRGTFTDADFTFKLSAVEVGEGGKVVSKIASDFELYASHYGLSKSDLGKRFTANGKTFILQGLKRQNRKYPFIARDITNGRDVKMPEGMVTMAFGL
jgi:hypothetical protein